MFLGQKIRPPKAERSSGDGLKLPVILEKWKTSVFPYSSRREVIL